ncbi:hypothetical protein GF402_01490 [Candidatus Fermentibacteria bacterium]|nr:hypothetical protein [Candidatus Fermentibacteria bacterium]
MGTADRGQDQTDGPGAPHRSPLLLRRPSGFRRRCLLTTERSPQTEEAFQPRPGGHSPDMPPQALRRSTHYYLERGECWISTTPMGMTAMSKMDTEYLEYLWPMRHYLVTCGDEQQPNIIAVGFCMPISREPPMVACAIGKQAHSTQLIRQTEEFVINVPTQDLERQVYYCGYHSGRDVDKFEQTGLTPKPARHLATPIIEECVAHLECRLEREVDTGDKVLFIATVLDAYADADVVRGERKPEYALGSFPEKVYGGRFQHPNNENKERSTEGDE